MGIRIQQLSSAIANQIAAGEVIERPASVVKELLENSLDAGADTITVEIGYGGLNQIKVSDNGSGIIAEDLPLAVAAHATSKITTLDDLYAIDSMGFRGEALASIASVAKVTISSRPAQQEHAMMLHVHNEKFTLSPCARNIGTTIDVVDLFFNAPVRKRFLKNEKLEFQAIEMVIKRFALSAPHIGLTLKHNNKLVLSLPAAVNERARELRITKIFGTAFVKDAIYLDVEQGMMRLCGWVSGPCYQRSQNDRQWVYINQRMVKDKLINHALKQAYDGLLYPGRFPACLLYLTIQKAEVDVNVHPTKHEVRFQQPRLVHDFFTSQLEKALQSSLPGGKESGCDYASHFDKNTNICEPSPFPNRLSATAVQPRLSPAAEQDEVIDSLDTPVAQWTAIKKGIPSSLNRDVRPSPYSRTQSSEFLVKDDSTWVLLNNQYVIIFLRLQPHIVDVITLQQKWLLEQLHQAKLPLESRPLLVPVSYEMPARFIERSEELRPYLTLLGIKIECSKDDRIVILSVPIKIPYLDIRLFLKTVSELEVLHIEHLLELISRSQSFDAKLLSTEERMELNQYLLDLQNQQFKSEGICKILTVDDCRMFLHV